MTRAPDFRVSSGFRDHPKAVKLERLLGEGAVLAWLQLLAYASLQRPDGRLTKMDPEDIAIAARWKGEASKFIDTLVTLRLLDRRGRVLSLHNWSIHNGYAAAFNKRSEHARKAINARWDRRLSGPADGIPENNPSNTPSNTRVSRCDSLFHLSSSSLPDPSPKPKSKSQAIDIWFDREFLASYPADHHDQLKTARAYLRKHKPDAAERARILATLELWKVSPDWLKDGGKWIKGIGNFFSDGLHLRKPAGVEAGPHYETAAEIAARENGAASASSDPQADAKFHKILDGVMQ